MSKQHAKHCNSKQKEHCTFWSNLKECFKIRLSRTRAAEDGRLLLPNPVAGTGFPLPKYRRKEPEALHIQIAWCLTNMHRHIYIILSSSIQTDNVLHRSLLQSGSEGPAMPYNMFENETQVSWKTGGKKKNKRDL